MENYNFWIRLEFAANSPIGEFAAVSETKCLWFISSWFERPGVLSNVPSGYHDMNNACQSQNYFKLMFRWKNNQFSIRREFAANSPIGEFQAISERNVYDLFRSDSETQDCSLARYVDNMCYRNHPNHRISWNTVFDMTFWSFQFASKPPPNRLGEFQADSKQNVCDLSCESITIAGARVGHKWWFGKAPITRIPRKTFSDGFMNWNTQ